MPHELPLPSSTPHLDKADLRRAGRDVLSLALMDARNHTLFLIGEYQKAIEDISENEELDFPHLPELNPPLWELGRIGWFQERWIGRNLQRHRGPRADPQVIPLGSIFPKGDPLWSDWGLSHEGRWAVGLPPLDDIKDYLLGVLETTLDLLALTPDEPDALYFYRLALFHEDMRGEAFVHMAQTLGLHLRLPLPAPGVERAPLVIPAGRWMQGLDSKDGAGESFIFDNEGPAHEVSVPEFEIDAQPVSWAQYAEFVADGGYDRAEFWQPAGWEWLQAQQKLDEGRSAPRHVQQIGVVSNVNGARGGGVLQDWFGHTLRMASWSPAMHLTWWEADAWCRWAGRRLPTEVEWEVAAHKALNRGFRWGEVWEWTATTFNPYPGFVPGPWRAFSEPHFGKHKVLRGASLATRARMKSPKFRHHEAPEADYIFCGFRSCAL
jgi:ergothioneine biosynthesis protein EgtB